MNFAATLLILFVGVALPTQAVRVEKYFEDNPGAFFKFATGFHIIEGFFNEHASLRPILDTCTLANCTEFLNYSTIKASRKIVKYYNIIEHCLDARDMIAEADRDLLLQEVGSVTCGMRRNRNCAKKNGNTFFTPNNPYPSCKSNLDSIVCSLGHIYNRISCVIDNGGI